MGEGAVVGHVGTPVRVGRAISQLGLHSFSCREWGAGVVSSEMGSNSVARTHSVRSRIPRSKCLPSSKTIEEARWLWRPHH